MNGTFLNTSYKYSALQDIHIKYTFRSFTKSRDTIYFRNPYFNTPEI